MNSLTLFKLIAWAAAIFNATTAALVLVYLSRPRNGRKPTPISVLLRAPAALLAAIGCFMVEAVLAIAAGGPFGLILLAYLSVALTPPGLACGLAWVARYRLQRGQRVWPLYAIAFTFLAPAAICAYASWIAPFQLVTERAHVKLPNIAPGAGVRIGVFSDLQTDRITSYEIEAIDRLMAEKPDIILLPGDYFQMPSRQIFDQRPELRALLNRLEAPFGCFGVLGNVDRPKETADLLAGTSIQLLINRVEIVDTGKLRIAIGGVELNYDSPAARRTVRELRDTPADVRLLVSHMPDIALLIDPDHRIDLVVAGHTHGGQVVIPGFGPPLTLTRVRREVAAGGLHRAREQLIYVSRGVGHERGLAPPVRLFCPPEVTVLTLTNPN